MTEKCKNCCHFNKAKDFVNHEWKHFHICTVLLDEEDGFALVVEEGGMCEMFSPKESDTE